jgi:hypothetical protein
MKNIFLAATFFAILTTVTSCKKDDPNNPNSPNAPSCQKNNWGSLAVDNYLKDPYKVYLDGAYKGTVSAYGYTEYSNLSAKTYSTKYVQASGYVFYPTEFTKSVTITKCYKTTISLQ